MANLFSILPQTKNPNLYNDWENSLTGNLNLTPAKSSTGFESTYNKPNPLVKPVVKVAKSIYKSQAVQGGLEVLNIPSFIAEQATKKIVEKIPQLPTIVKKYAPLTAGLAAGFLNPVGETKVVSLLKEAKTIQEVNKALKTAGIAEDVIKSVASKFTELTDAKIITTELQKARQVSSAIKPLQPLAQEAGKDTITLYRAAPKFPSDKFSKGTYFADSEQSARYYSESHYKGSPSDIKVEQFTLPKDAVFKEPSTGNYILKGDAPVSRASIKPLSPSQAIPKGISKERGFITSVKEAMPEVKVAGQYIPKANDPLMIKASNLVKNDIGTAERMAMGTDDNAVAVGTELLKKYNAEGQYERAAELAHSMASNLTEAGRTVQAASMLGRLTPEGQLKFAASEINAYNEAILKSKGGLFGLKKQIPQLTEQQSKEILTESKRIFEMADGETKAIAFKSLQNKISDLVPSPLYQKIISVWKAGLLTGIKTSGLNEMSNLFHGVSEIAKDIPAVVVDKVSSLFTGKRTLGLTTKGTVGGVEEGFSKGWRYFKTGYDERNIGAKLDFKRVNFGTSKVAKGLQKYEETIFHLLGAEDQPFYYGAKARSLQSQAIAQAKNAGLKGTEATVFIEKLVQSPTDEMLKYAVKDAEVSVFQNRTLLGEAAKKIQNIPGGEIIVPFGRTPASVATQMVNYSPVGIVKTIVENIGKGKFDQRLFSQGLGRAITGTGVMYIGMELAKNGMITLGYPKDDKVRKQWELEGKKENSFYDPLTKKWRNINVFGPAGNVLVMGAYLQKGIEDTGSFVQGMIQASAGAVSSIKDQTFLQGLNSFVQAINDPQGYAVGMLSSLEGSIIPTIAGDISTATDTTQRNTSIKKAGWFGPLMAKIPGLRQKLQPKIDVLGQQVPRAGNIIETMIDPSRPLNIRSTSVVEELKRLDSVGQLATPTTYADEKQFTSSLTKEQITQLQQRAGMILESKLKNLFSLPEYKKLPDDEKAKTIGNFTSKARLVARTEMALQLTQGLSGDELKNKLSELKKNGFLTKEVFTEFTKMR